MLFEADYAKNYASIMYQCLRPGFLGLRDAYEASIERIMKIVKGLY